ncbi:MAG TPA: glucoamylase family protein, partial [Elusimicrobiota bacterium]|nr:glucoamylase family protein [Elusimicrobiota bacterium]
NIRFNTRAASAGTLAVYGAAGSINFIPEASIAALRHYFDIPGLWSPLFGFGDAFSLDPHYIGGVYDAQGNPDLHFADYLNGPWINHMTMGINEGPLLLAVENHRTRFIWQLTRKSPEIEAGLERIFGLSAPVRYAAAIERTPDDDYVSLHWDPVAGAAQYSVYSSSNLKDWTLRQSGLTATTWADMDLGKDNRQRFYCLKALK